MAIATWSALNTESANLTTPLNGVVTGTTVLIGDIENTTNKNLYLGLWFQSGTMTPSSTGSISVILRRKRGSIYAENNSEIQVLGLTGTGSRQINLAASLRIPYAATWGLFIQNNLGSTIPSSGNTLVSFTWNEEVN
jgi:hypothetical protein